MLSEHPDVQTRLRDELRSVPHPFFSCSGTSQPSLPSPRSLECLPYLHAVIKESLRLRGAVATPNPRLTPRGTTIALGDHFKIPSGVRISTYAWCLHRNEHVFPNAEAFSPERWLDRDKATAEQMERWFWAFGSGSRMCLGRNLAMEMIRYVVVAIYTHFETVTVALDKDGATGKDGIEFRHV